MDLGKILLIISVLAAIVMVYVKSPPLSPEIFVLVFGILAAAIAYNIWQARGKWLYLQIKRKRGISFILFVSLLTCFLIYGFTYDQHVYYNPDSPEEYIYLPFTPDDTIAESLEKVGGKLPMLATMYGFPIIQTQVNGNTSKTEYLIIDAFFMSIALFGFAAFFLLLVFLYMETWIKGSFASNKELANLRQAILLLVRNNQMDVALKQMIDSPDLQQTKVKTQLINMLARLEDIEHRFATGQMADEVYDRNKNKLRQGLLKMII